MLTYKAMYKFLDQGVHAEVLDFPGAITSADTLDEARRLLGRPLFAFHGFGVSTASPRRTFRLHCFGHVFHARQQVWFEPRPVQPRALDQVAPFDAHAPRQHQRGADPDGLERAFAESGRG